MDQTTVGYRRVQVNHNFLVTVVITVKRIYLHYLIFISVSDLIFSLHGKQVLVVRSKIAAFSKDPFQLNLRHFGSNYLGTKDIRRTQNCLQTFVAKEHFSMWDDLVPTSSFTSRGQLARWQMKQQIIRFYNATVDILTYKPEF